MAQVSVIIPAYNAHEYIGECLNSVLAQTLSDIEILVVDDGSTDDTLSCVQAFAATDSRIKVFSQQNQYAGVARNRGISEASGRFLYFLDADDWIEPDALRVMVDSANLYESDVVVARSEAFENRSGSAWVLGYALNGVPYESVLKPVDYAEHLFQYFMGWPWDKLYRADFVAREQLQFQGLRTTNDAYFVFCSLALASAVTCCDRILFHHRANNSKSLEGSRSMSWHCALDAMNSIDNKLKTLDLYPAFRRSFCNWVMNYSYWSVSTLPNDVADAYLNELAGVAADMPLDKDYYPGLHERLFREFFNKTKSELLIANVVTNEALSEASHFLDEFALVIEEKDRELVNLQNTLSEAERRTDSVYQSHSYRLGNLFMKPLRIIRDFLRRPK